ncbi:hypothetical protein CKA32_000144 [Geitlerinema sp. FC II]|nr:hypothetical protein CKA32_000144 [Geitlerinema sp. FC II]
MLGFGSYHYNPSATRGGRQPWQEDAKERAVAVKKDEES